MPFLRAVHLRLDPAGLDKAVSKFDVAKSAYRHWMGSFEHDDTARHLPSGVSTEVAPVYISLVTTSELLLATCMFLGGHRVDATTLFKVYCFSKLVQNFVLRALTWRCALCPCDESCNFFVVEYRNLCLACLSVWVCEPVLIDLWRRFDFIAF